MAAKKTKPPDVKESTVQQSAHDLLTTSMLSRYHLSGNLVKANRILTEVINKEKAALMRLHDLSFATATTSGCENRQKHHPEEEHQQQDHHPTRPQLAAPITSSQEIGWFNTHIRLSEIRMDARVEHQHRLTDITRYMDTFWSYYKPQPAKFYPKSK